MSTRANVVIVKNGYSPVFLYHHHDGYPNGVGEGLSEYANELLGKDEAVRKSIISNPMKLERWLTDSERDDEYESTDGLHGDIEYLYVINLDNESVACYDAWEWERNVNSEEDAIKGKLPLAYTASLWDDWDEVEINEDYK